MAITSVFAEVYYPNASAAQVRQILRDSIISRVNDIEIYVSYMDHSVPCHIIQLLPDGTMLHIDYYRNGYTGDRRSFSRVGSYVITNDTLLCTPILTGNSDNFTPTDSLPYLIYYYDYPTKYKYIEGRELIEIVSFNIEVIECDTTKDEIDKNMLLSCPPQVFKRVKSYFINDSVSDNNILDYDTTNIDNRNYPSWYSPRPEGLQIIRHQL